MFRAVKEHARRLLRRPVPLPPPAFPFYSTDMARQQARITRAVRPYTMTSPERVAALCQAVAYLEGNRTPGDVVECGVWKGGSTMAAALALLHLGSTTRRLYLFDTFAGMTPPADVDRDLHGRPAGELLRAAGLEGDMVRASATLAEVKAAMLRTHYPWEKLTFAPGRVEDTLPAAAPSRIALLRLDTDWYESTYHELTHLWPRLVDGGVLIVDDYGHWQGARLAVDRYFAEHGIDAELHAVDYTGRLVIKRPRCDAAVESARALVGDAR